MIYPLLFLNGECGWNSNLEHVEEEDLQNVLRLHSCNIIPTGLLFVMQISSSCIPLNAPVFGSMKCSTTAPEVGSSCTFECQSTHYFKGNSTRICTEDLRWTGSAGYCIMKSESCIPLKAPVFGSMKCSTTAVEVGSSCTFECQSTHYLRGTSTRTCAKDLRWTGIAARCIMKSESCLPLKPPAFGSMKCSTTALKVGSSCTFECQSTHYLRGTSTRTCSENLRWTGTASRCIMKSECSEPPPLHQGTVTGCSPYRKPRYNDTCYFRCNEGFLLVGPSYLKCRLDGRLTDEKGHQRFPRCETSVPVNSSLGAIPGNTDFQNKPRPVSPTSWLSCQVHNGYCSHYCHQEPKGIRCSCRSGYRLSNDGKTCIETFSVYPYPNVAVTPVDEDFRNTPRPVSPPSWLSCQLHKGYCSHHCHQEPAGVRCSCRSGYRLSQNGRTCTDVDECQNESLNKCDHICRNTVGSFKCLCRQGYTSPDGFRCEERLPSVAVTPGDEDFRNTPRPISPTSRLSCQEHNGYCSHHCHQEPEGVRCSCRSGYRLSRDARTCTDVDECQDERLSKCDHLCRNTVGSYKCLCRQGYTSPDGFRCEDVDECLDDRLNKCDHTCRNTEGGYICSCREGFVSSDGFRCEGCRVNSYRTATDVSCKECPANSHTDG
ncbi:Multiple epidermal growth factor-like domains protein 6, partial [Araneus ventricosus]